MTSHRFKKLQHEDGNEIDLDEEDGVSSPLSEQKHLLIAENERAASDMVSPLEISARNRRNEEVMERTRRRRRRRIKKKTSSVSSSVRTLRLKKDSSSLLIGKVNFRGTISTPVHSWKLFRYGRSSEGLLLDRDEDVMSTMNQKKKKNKKKNDSPHIPHDDVLLQGSELPGIAHISARRLASALWEAQHAPFFREENKLKLTRKRQPFYHPQIHPSDQHQNQALQHRINSKIEASRRNAPSANEPESSNELLMMLHHVWSLEEQHKSNLLSMSGLRSELDQCRKQLQKLLQSEKNHQIDMEILARKLMEERSMWMNQQEESIQLALLSVKEELHYERNAKNRLERLHKRMERDLHNVKKALGKALYDLERERKARELVEDVCDELAREVRECKAREEELRRESAEVREEVEEERKMLQMAEVWREERVQMKLMEAKLEIERKNEVLDKLRMELDNFLMAKRVVSVKEDVNHIYVDTTQAVYSKQPKDDFTGENSVASLHSCVQTPKLHELVDPNADDSSDEEADRCSIQTSDNGDRQQTNDTLSYCKVGGNWKKLSTNRKASNKKKLKHWPNAKLRGLDETRNRKRQEGQGRGDFHDGMEGSNWTVNADIGEVRRQFQRFMSLSPKEGGNGEQYEESGQLESSGMNAVWLRQMVESSRGLPTMLAPGQMHHQRLYGKSSPTHNWKDFWSSLQPGSPVESMAKGFE